MEFCKNCGAALNGANFCANCGTSAKGEMMAQQGYMNMQMTADPRQRSLADMEQMISYFGAKKKWYDDYDMISKEVEDRSSRSYGGWIGAAVISALLGIFNGAIFFYIAAVAFIALFILLKKKNKAALAVATSRQENLHKKLTEYYESYGYCSVGMEYTKPDTLNVLHDLIRKGRANTPGEAINVHLADKAQEEMRRLQEEATEAAKETARNTKKAAKQARRAAGYASASFWFK